MQQSILPSMQRTELKQFLVDIPVAARALQQLQAHQQQGYAEADLASVILQVEQKAK